MESKKKEDVGDIIKWIRDRVENAHKWPSQPWMVSTDEYRLLANRLEEAIAVRPEPKLWAESRARLKVSEDMKKRSEVLLTVKEWNVVKDALEAQHHECCPSCETMMEVAEILERVERDQKGIA